VRLRVLTAIVVLTATAASVGCDAEGESGANITTDTSTDLDDAGSTELDLTEPDAAEPDAAEPDTAEPDTAEPDSTEPDSAEPDSTDSACAPSPCENGAACIEQVDGFTCLCQPGFMGNTCETNIDDCPSSGCLNGGTCTDGIQSFECDCPSGYAGALCEIVTDSCIPNPCVNGGTCNGEADGWSCTCAAGYEGDTCASNIDDCAKTPCLNGGTCVDELDGFSCMCPPGFWGPICGDNLNDCSPDPCQNGGNCQDGANTFSCDCPAGWAGDTCADAIVSCSPNPCINGGICSENSGAVECDCAAGYEGTTCATNTNDCAESPCQNGGTCIDEVDGFSCDCVAGFEGDTCGSEVAPTEGTGDILCAFSQSVYNDDESVEATSTADWSCDATTRSLSANGLPDHEVGTFPNANNPTGISAQTVEVSFPLEPEIASETGTPAQVVAYCLNGVKFEVGTAGTCTDAGACAPIGNGGSWSMEAVGANSFDFGNDESHGHVQPSGSYHYHGIPEGFMDKLNKGQAMTLVGWAVDGFPIYARYGYTDPSNANSAIKPLTGSYVIKDPLDAGRPSVDVYGPGAFTQDWEYSPASGDLDECNGRFGVTPEFPGGIYHYYLTDSFPFGQRCVKGTAGGDGPGGTGPPSCDAVPAGAPCCGDNFCGGPETPANCPSDC
jgi:hypothetical protein